MPLVAHNALPTFARLHAEGANVVAADAALHQDIRELHVGLLNMMPDKALGATERQFFRLVGQSNQIAQIYMHPFSLGQIERGPQARAHIERFYESFEQVRRQGLDALIITGANVAGPDLTRQAFWQPLMDVTDWALENTTSVLCSCLATHSLLQFRYRIRRRPLGYKRWGVYPHRITDRSHPLVAGVNTRFDVPHSRFNEVSEAQMREAGLVILAASAEAGVHLATSEDGFRLVFFQGHPEYDHISLLKEYKREVGAWLRGEREDYPPFPENYLRPRHRALLNEYRDRVKALRGATAPPEFPERYIVDELDNTWHDTGKAVVNNWIGQVYRITNVDRRRPFMPGIEEDDPLGWRAATRDA